MTQQLTFTPYHASGIYDVGETVGWTVTPGPVTPTYAYKWTIRRNNAVVLKEGKLDLSSGKDQDRNHRRPARDDLRRRGTVRQSRTAEAAPRPASPRRRTGRARSGYVGGNTGRNNGLYAVGAAVAPAKIGLSTPRPDDFDAFWDGKLAAQAKIPINPVLTPVQTDVPGVEMNMFVLDALGSQDAWLCGQTREGRQISRADPIAVCGRVRVERARRRAARRRRLADDQRGFAR